MGIADIPTSLGSSFLVRALLPGFIASFIYFFTFKQLYYKYPLIRFSMPIEITTILDTFAILSFLAFIVGMMLSELDVQIYQLFESLRFWPTFIWNLRYKMALKKFEKIDYRLKAIKLRKKAIKEMGESISHEVELRDLAIEESEISSKVRELPFNPDRNYLSKRYPEAATRFGNVIAEYEGYPEIQYGMHMMVFWQHLWFILPSEVKEDLDLRGAKVDFLVYLSFIFLTYAFIGTAAILLLSGIEKAIICMTISLSLFFLFYQASISSVKNYGRYIKAVFDLYRFELAEKMGINISTKNLVPDDDEIKRWRKLRSYLLDYKK